MRSFFSNLNKTRAVCMIVVVTSGLLASAAVSFAEANLVYRPRTAGLKICADLLVDFAMSLDTEYRFQKRRLAPHWRRFDSRFIAPLVGRDYLVAYSLHGSAYRFDHEDLRDEERLTLVEARRRARDWARETDSFGGRAIVLHFPSISLDPFYFPFVHETKDVLGGRSWLPSFRFNPFQRIRNKLKDEPKWLRAAYKAFGGGGDVSVKSAIDYVRSLTGVWMGDDELQKVVIGLVDGRPTLTRQYVVGYSAHGSSFVVAKSDPRLTLAEARILQWNWEGIADTIGGRAIVLHIPSAKLETALTDPNQGPDIAVGFSEDFLDPNLKKEF